LRPMLKLLLDGKLPSRELWLRRKRSKLLLKLKPKKSGQPNSLLSRNHGESLLLTSSKNHNLLLPELKSKLVLLTLVTPVQI